MPLLLLSFQTTAILLSKKKPNAPGLMIFGSKWIFLLLNY